MRLYAIVSTFALLGCGCASLQDWHYSAINEFRAYRAWSASPHEECGEWSADYAGGWRLGYFDVSMGRSGQGPVIPPQKYWSATYQELDSRGAIDAWYRGYHAGATVAAQDGFGARHHLSAYMVGPPAPAATLAPPLARSVELAPELTMERLPPLPADEFDFNLPSPAPVSTHP